MRNPFSKNKSILNNNNSSGLYEFSQPTDETDRSADRGEEISDAWDERLRLASDPFSPTSESLRSLRSRILHSDEKPKTLLVTSLLPGEGKGFICANLGISLSQDMEHNVLLLDCDLRRPTLAQLFGVSNETGISEYLSNSAGSVLKIKKTGQKKLSLISSGRSPGNPSELICSKRMIALIDKLVEENSRRIILVDSPPIGLVAETSVLAKYLDGVIFVIRHGVAPKEQIKKIMDLIGPEKIRGIVYNAKPNDTVRSFLHKTMGYGYGAGYGYGYGYDYHGN